MVTGDNLTTAKAIARECGILTDGEAVDGPTFRHLNPDEMKKLIPNLQVESLVELTLSLSSLFLLVGNFPCYAIFSYVVLVFECDRLWQGLRLQINTPWFVSSVNWEKWWL